MWIMFTRIGDAALTLPIAAVCACWLALFNVRLACLWAATLAAGMAAVGTTKILYAGWGVYLPALDFRVISGHTMLSTSIWMVALALQLKWWRLPAVPGIAAGFAIGVMTGISRVLDHSHSLPEVVAGWILGVAVAGVFLPKALRVEFSQPKPAWSALSLVAVATLAYGHTAPIQYLIDEHSPAIHRHVPAVSALLNHIGLRAEIHDAASTK